MKYSEVLNRYVNTGSRIPEKQYSRLSPSLKKSYLRIRGVAGYERWEFKTLSDDEKIKFIESKGTENLLSDDLEYLYQFSKNKDYYISKVIYIIGEELSEYDIEFLLEYSDNKVDIVSKIINAKDDELTDYDIYKLIPYSDEIAIKYIEKKREELNRYDVKIILDSTKTKYNIAKKIIEVKGKKLDTEDINNLLNISQDNYNKDEIATKIIETQSIELNSRDIYLLLASSKETNNIAIKIIKSKGEKLEYDDIVYLFKFSQNRESLKKPLLQQGIDYELINSVIRFNDFGIKKIPDNYQKTLNEIKRIKTNNVMRFIITESQLKKLIKSNLKESPFTYDMYRSLEKLRNSLDRNQIIGVAYVLKNGEVRHMAFKRYLKSYVPSERPKTDAQMNLQQNNNVVKVIDLTLYRKILKTLQVRVAERDNAKSNAAQKSWKTINLGTVLGFLAGGEFIDLREENDIMERFGEDIYNSLTKGMIKKIEEEYQEALQDEEI
jgi:hypothetical protein